MPDCADPFPSQPDPDMPPRKPLAGSGGKLKKPLTDKQRAAAEQRLAHLRSSLLLRPLDGPSRTLPPPHEAALRALGLLDFAHLDLASDAPRPDLVAPLVAYYDPACKRSFVRGVRVAVSRHDLARALSLPPKPAATAEAPPDVDPAAVASAVMHLLQEYVLLPFQGDDMCILPQEVAAAEQAVREGAAHRVDWTGLIWGLVEKEMLELPKRDDGVCYYGPHLQRLIWAQKPKLFEQVEQGDRGELVREASVDVDMEEEDEDAVVKSKSLEELELADGDADARSKSLKESEFGNADARSKGLDELELGDANTRNKILEELGLGDEDVRSKSMEESEAVDEDAKFKSLDESEALDEDARGKSLDESEAVDEDAKCKSLDESEALDEDARGKSLDESEAVDEDAKCKSLDESEEVDEDAKCKILDESEAVDEDAKCKILDESEAVDEDAKCKSLDESEAVDEDAKCKSLDESEAVDEDAKCKSLDESEAVEEDAKCKSLDESEAVEEDAKCKSLDESEAVHEDAKGTSFDELGTMDEPAKGTDMDEFGLGFVTVAGPGTHEVMPLDNDDAVEAAPERSDDVAVAEEEDGEGPSVDIVVTQEEVVAVAEDVGAEETEGEEEKDATGLSLGINSTDGYDSMDVEEDMNVENLDEDGSGNEEAEESEDDAFEECNGREDMNWRIGDGKGDEGMTHCLQRCNTFGGMEFENLNKGEAEMRDELRFDSFSGRGSLERMTSSNLLEAMNSIPPSYNVTENVHDLSSGEFLAMGADAHKNGVDLGPGTSYLFGNNGKRHIGDSDGYNDNMQVQEQFPQSNQQKKMRHSNSSSISPGSAVFNANISLPVQNLMVEASRLYGQMEQEVQSLQFEKQQWANMLQQKEAIIQSLNSSRFEQQNKYQVELRRFEHDLNVMAQLVTGYKKALKQTRASFDEYRKKFPCNKPRYVDVPGGGGLVLSVRELERKQLEEQQQKLAAANEMIGKFRYEWFSKLDEWMLSVDSLGSRIEELSKEINLLKENRKTKYATLATEE
ncbi:uncharacterized protein LOC133883640 [Phragmites australis]|uniref:uncharacterized protein LOC133883640 n=1 Tax=Phragmites australis TaxID=29695 RepID=UPI002D77C559|nr:uncharacterized protein LOC133883640 [Phragmites australis]XP_062178999.1 uncharacterized protein LOC133883640 [Phragmites australis]